jgi:hypothetical protein
MAFWHDHAVSHDSRNTGQGYGPSLGEEVCGRGYQLTSCRAAKRPMVRRVCSCLCFMARLLAALRSRLNRREIGVKWLELRNFYIQMQQMNLEPCFAAVEGPADRLLQSDVGIELPVSKFSVYNQCDAVLLTNEPLMAINTKGVCRLFADLISRRSPWCSEMLASGLHCPHNAHRQMLG